NLSEARGRVGYASQSLNSRHPVLWVVARRLVRALPILFIVPLVTATLARLTLVDQPPGSFSMVEASGEFSYWHWLGGLFSGHLGVSLLYGEGVGHFLAPRIPVTVALLVGTLLFSLLIGGALGIWSAVRGRVLGRLLDAFAVVGFAFPVFWLGP